MKKILALSAFAILGVIGCASPTDNLCLKSAECAGEDDPAKFCSDAKDDQSDDDKACADTCKSQSDAFAQCELDNGKCEDKVFGAKAAGDDCKDQLKDLGDCAADC
jgi:hypothetical protein